MKSSPAVTLYDYQEQMVRRIKDALSRPLSLRVAAGGQTAACGNSVMVQMPTGTGKTVVIAAVIKWYLGTCREKEVWVLAHRRELTEQTADTLARFGIAAGTGDSAETAGGRSRVRVMSVQWLSRHAGGISVKPGLVVVDEAHHSVAATYRALWDKFPEAGKLGMTATPCRMQKKSFLPLYDCLLASWSIKEFIRRGRLSLYDYVASNANSEEQRIIDGLERRGADGDYSVPEMSRKLGTPALTERLYCSIQQYAPGKKGIVYAVDIRHANGIAAFYSAKGVSAAAIDCKTPPEVRRQYVEDFKKGNIRVIVNVDIFSEGFDCPDVEFIQIARPTLSLSKYMQMIGRGLRVHDDKKLCVIIDNAGLYRMFGLPDAGRDWPGMFAGKAAGKGRHAKRRACVAAAADNEMEVVANHSRQLPMTEDGMERYLSQAEPFEKGGRWGLRVGSDVILPPVYRRIMPFAGNYAAFELLPGKWGVLLRNGRQYVVAEFGEVTIAPGGEAVMKRSETDVCRVDLNSPFKDGMHGWWDRYCSPRVKRMIEKGGFRLSRILCDTGSLPVKGGEEPSVSATDYTDIQEEYNCVPLKPYKDRETGLWGLKRGKETVFPAQFVKAGAVSGSFAIIELPGNCRGVADAGTAGILRLGKCKDARFCGDDFLQVTGARDDVKYLDLRNGRWYASPPQIFRYGNIQILLAGNHYYSRTRKPYESPSSVARRDISYKGFYLLLQEHDTPKPCRTFGASDGKCTCRCILEGDRDCVYYLCGAIDDDNIVVMDTGGLYYHVERGKGKRYIASSRPQTESEEFDTAVAGLIERITGENASAMMRKENAGKRSKPRRQKAADPLWSRRAGK